MSTYYWTSTGTSTAAKDPTLSGNWTKSDGTTTAIPGAGDDVYVQAVPGISLADIWAAGGANLTAPGSLSTSGAASTGGSLAQSTTYYYKVAAISTTAGINGEGPLSAEQSYAVPASGTATNQITINWAAVTGATGYKIYRSTTTSAELYLATVGAVLLYADTSATTPAGSPPGTVTFASLTISSTYTGKIGEGGTGGYWKQPATLWTIGTPPAASQGVTATGSGRIKLDFSTVQFAGTVLSSGTATDTGFEPVIVKGTHASNALTVMGGTVGVATATPGESATIFTSNISGSAAIVHFGSGVTWGASSSTANVSGAGKFTADTGAASAMLSVSANSTATIAGTVKVGTINSSGSLVLNQRPGSGSLVDTLNLYSAGTADFSGNPVAGTVATLNQYAGSKVVTSPASPDHITITTYHKIGGGNLALSA